MTLTREELRTYLLKRIDSLLTGWWTARFLTDQDKAVLHAEYQLYQQDKGPVLDWLLQHMPEVTQDMGQPLPLPQPEDLSDLIRAVLTLRAVKELTDECLAHIDRSPVA